MRQRLAEEVEEYLADFEAARERMRRFAGPESPIAKRELPPWVGYLRRLLEENEKLKWNERLCDH